MVSVISDEGLSLSWAFNEEASAICELHSPSMLKGTIVSCSNNYVLLPYANEGYSLFIQGTDMEGNVAEPAQLTWSIGKTCTITMNKFLTHKHTHTHIVKYNVIHTHVHTNTQSTRYCAHYLGTLMLGTRKSIDLNPYTPTVLCREL